MSDFVPFSNPAVSPPRVGRKDRLFAILALLALAGNATLIPPWSWALRLNVILAWPAGWLARQIAIPFGFPETAILSWLLLAGACGLLLRLKRKRRAGPRRLDFSRRDRLTTLLLPVLGLLLIATARFSLPPRQAAFVPAGSLLHQPLLAVIKNCEYRFALSGANAYPDRAAGLPTLLRRARSLVPRKAEELRFSLDCRRLFWKADDTWNILDLASGASQGSFPGRLLALSPEGFFCAASGQDQLRFWDMREQPRLVWEIPEPRAEEGTISAAGHFLVLVDQSGRETLWDGRTGRPVPEMTLLAQDWCFSPDGRYLIQPEIRSNSFAVVRGSTTAEPPRHSIIPNWPGDICAFTGPDQVCCLDLWRGQSGTAISLAERQLISREKANLNRSDCLFIFPARSAPADGATEWFPPLMPLAENAVAIWSQEQPDAPHFSRARTPLPRLGSRKTFLLAARRGLSRIVGLSFLPGKRELELPTSFQIHEWRSREWREVRRKNLIPEPGYFWQLGPLSALVLMDRKQRQSPGMPNPNEMDLLFLAWDFRSWPFVPLLVLLFLCGGYCARHCLAGRGLRGRN